MKTTTKKIDFKLFILNSIIESKKEKKARKNRILKNRLLNNKLFINDLIILLNY